MILNNQLICDPFFFPMPLTRSFFFIVVAPPLSRLHQPLLTTPSYGFRIGAAAASVDKCTFVPSANSRPSTRVASVALSHGCCSSAGRYLLSCSFCLFDKDANWVP